MTTKLNINAINDSSITFDKLANDVVMDWNAKAGEKGYIDNRTHYVQFEGGNSWTDISYTDPYLKTYIIDSYTQMIEDVYYRVYRYQMTLEMYLESMYLRNNKTGVLKYIGDTKGGFVNFDDKLKIATHYFYNENTDADIYDIWVAIFCENLIDNHDDNELDDILLPYLWDNYDLVYSYISGFPKGFKIESIDEVYIPDTIARTSQIPTTLPANGGHADSSYMANRLDCPDTRDEKLVPNDTSCGLWTDFKQKNVTGLSAEYSGVISYRPYSQAGDWTGGPMHNLAFDENGIHHRKSNSDGAGWHGWRQIPYRDEVEKCPEHHRADEQLNLDACQLYDPNTGEYVESYYGDHSQPDVIFDYKYVGGCFDYNIPYNNYGGMLTFPWNQAKGNTGPNYASQLFIPHGDEEDGAIKFRTSQSEEWNSWRKVIDNANYTEYAAKHNHKHNVTAAGNVSLSGSVDSNGILTISATFTGTQVEASTPTA